MKVVSYLKSVPVRNTNIQKTELLIKYIAGTLACKDHGIVHDNHDIIDCDVAVIQGWVHENKISPHLRLRNLVITAQLQRGKYVCAADANLFLFADKNNRHGYLRYSFNGIFPNTGLYCDNNIDSTRWNQISKDNNIVIDEKNDSGSTILIMLQRNGGWSMNGTEVVNWIMQTINNIRQYSDRPILIRAHPGDKQAINYLKIINKKVKLLNKVKVSKLNTSLEEDLTNTWCVVNHNSSAIVGPIIKGYAAFITDPIRSQCQDVADTDFSKIETPSEFDREKWLQRISQFHWKFSELEDGSCWKHMRNYCQ